MKNTLLSCIINLTVLYNSSIYCQEEPEDITRTSGVNCFAYPFLFYSPETDWAFGAGGIVSFKLSDNFGSKPSNITGSGYYTINNQYDITLIPEVYFNQDKLQVWFNINYSKLFDRFYGIGSNTPDIKNEKYFQQNFVLKLKLLSGAFEDELKLGIIYEYRNMDVVDKRDNPFLQSVELPGNEGGTTSGFGIVATWDSRDKVYYPASGGYYEFSFNSFRKEIGSLFNYNKYILDLRSYFEPFHQHILAIQSYLLTETGSPPFYDLALLGGDKLMRGYITGRYRDKNYYVLQAEYRTPPLWKFRIVFFGGFGDVASAISKITISTIKHSYGTGVRFRLDEIEKLDLRMDVGFGKETSGIYFGINQAF